MNKAQHKIHAEKLRIEAGRSAVCIFGRIFYNWKELLTHAKAQGYNGCITTLQTRYADPTTKTFEQLFKKIPKKIVKQHKLEIQTKYQTKWKNLNEIADIVNTLDERKRQIKAKQFLDHELDS